MSLRSVLILPLIYVLLIIIIIIIIIGKDKILPVTGRGVPYGRETSRLPDFLYNRLRDSGDVVSLTHQPYFTPQEDSWYSFLLRG
jgi:uncharacterized membrane protein YkgB